MYCSAAWRIRLASPAARKVLLVTLFPRIGRSPETTRHPAYTAEALRFATHPDVTIAERPFWPLLASWPVVERSITPHLRQAPVAETTVEFLSTARVPTTIAAMGDRYHPHCRIDLWSDGLTLDETLPLLEGPILDAETNRLGAITALRVADGSPANAALWPPGGQAITLEEFPDLPRDTFEHGKRQILFGPLQTALPAFQIDTEGFQFYIADAGGYTPPFQSVPSRVWVGATEVAAKEWAITTRETAATRMPYTHLQFLKKPAQDWGAGGVLVEGGMGYRPGNTFDFLLKDIGGFGFQPFAQAMTRTDPFWNMSVYQNTSGSVIEIVRDRLCRQIDLLMGFHLNRIECYRLLGPMPLVTMALGSELRDRLAEQPGITNQDDIRNVIAVAYRRDPSRTSLTPVTNALLTVDEQSGGAIARHLTESQRLFGRRYIQLDAADLLTAEQAWSLGSLEALLLGLPHQRHAYSATWLDGMTTNLNWRARLVDEREGIDCPCRVIGQRVLPSGPELIFQSEDLPG